MNGGGNGKPGRVVMNPGTDTEKAYTGLISYVPMAPGDVIRMETASAAGVGDPKKRQRERVASDLRNGYISEETALDVYGMSTEEVEAAVSIS